jgi:4-carboxymuconolactone decarboxylase
LGHCRQAAPRPQSRRRGIEGVRNLPRSPRRRWTARADAVTLASFVFPPSQDNAAMPPRRAAKAPAYRLQDLTEEQMSAPQRALRDAIFAGPRGQRKKLNGPFAIWLQAPEFGDLAQKLGAHCRYKTALEPRLSEFAILVTAHLWKAQYEWYAHAPMAEKAGVKPATIKAIKAGRAPATAPKDERALYDFIRELYKTKRVSDRNYKRVQALLGDAGTVELVGILGYYALISMTLNVFRAPLPDDTPMPFKE